MGIEVVNSSKQHLYDADVTIADGDYIEHLQVTPATSTEPCTYYGADERPGTYTVTAAKAGESANGSSAKVAKLKVHSASCTGVELKRATVQL